MTYLGALVLGLVIHEGTRQYVSPRRAAGAAASATLVAAIPAGVSVVALGWALALLRARQVRPAATRDRTGPDRLGQVLYIALSAGLPVAAALEFAVGEVGPAEAAMVRSVLRAARHQGLAVALSGVEGSAGRLFAGLARAQLTGSSAIKAVASFVDEERKNRRARATEAAQRLPVKLTVPLALLILPGFVLLTVGPTVIVTVERLFGPLLS
ncbi:MAG TPA: type II secretion system F family protein [Acidimicrobiia bacterium]|nr:type II secretion system F family protein [Acidimicrobiia bacterium]